VCLSPERIDFMIISDFPLLLRTHELRLICQIYQDLDGTRPADSIPPQHCSLKASCEPASTLDLRPAESTHSWSERQFFLFSTERKKDDADICFCRQPALRGVLLKTNALSTRLCTGCIVHSSEFEGRLKSAKTTDTRSTFSDKLYGKIGDKM
jgi:hypothetical protein